MTPADAAKLLELPADATPDQIEARFLELRTKLEEKIGKAPTQGLKAKYRETLDEITQAFEVLTLAADSSSLPVLRKETGGGRPEAGGPASLQAAGDGSDAQLPRGSDSGLRSQVSGLPPRKRAKSGGREFALVAVIAVAVLAAGGWFIMKTRAENAEQARLVAEAKAAEERAAGEAEAAARAEAQRRESARAIVRGRLAELNVRLEAAYANERRIEASRQTTRADLEAERRASPGEPTVRMLVLQARAAALAKQGDDLRVMFSDHPARVSRRRAETMMEAKDLAEVEGVLNDFAGHIDSLERAILAGTPDLAGIERDTRLAAESLLRWRQHAAQDELARHLVRVFGLNPIGIPADEAAAIAWLRHAAGRGDAAAMYQVGLLQVAGRLPPPLDPLYGTGDRWIRQAADLGHPQANVWMGRMLQSSLLSPPFFKRAAEAGNPDGEYEYGLAVLTGWGPPADAVAGARWLESAARQGHAAAQYQLGRLYEQGRGVLANATTAYDWLRQAARQGDANAQTHLRNQGRNW